MKMKRRDLLKGMAGGLALAVLDAPGESEARTIQALPPEALGILYDSTLCVGCNACMAACNSADCGAALMLDQPGTRQALRNRPGNPPVVGHHARRRIRESHLDTQVDPFRDPRLEHGAAGPHDVHTYRRRGGQ